MHVRRIFNHRTEKGREELALAKALRTAAVDTGSHFQINYDGSNTVLQIVSPKGKTRNFDNFSLTLEEARGVAANVQRNPDYNGRPDIVIGNERGYVGLAGSLTATASIEGHDDIVHARLAHARERTARYARYTLIGFGVAAAVTATALLAWYTIPRLMYKAAESNDMRTREILEQNYGGQPLTGRPFPSGTNSLYQSATNRIGTNIEHRLN